MKNKNSSLLDDNAAKHPRDRTLKSKARRYRDVWQKIKTTKRQMAVWVSIHCLELLFLNLLLFSGCPWLYIAATTFVFVLRRPNRSI